MTGLQRVESLAQLKACLHALFGPDIAPVAMSDDELMFTVHGKIKTILSFLTQKTGQDGWRGESRFWCYVDEARNISIGLSSAPGCVMVSASVVSLHRAALNPYGR